MAVADVDEFTVTLLTVTSVPLMFTVMPDIKFVPVRVIVGIWLGRDEVGVMAVIIGASTGVLINDKPIPLGVDELIPYTTIKFESVEL